MIDSKVEKPFSDAMRTLSLMGDIEWMGLDAGYDELSPRRTPPHIMWRYKAESEGFDAWIRSVVEAFEGKVAWAAEKPGRNWIIRPKMVSEEIVRSPDVDAKKVYQAIGEANPEFANDAIFDLRPLLAHVRSQWSRTPIAM